MMQLNQCIKTCAYQVHMPSKANKKIEKKNIDYFGELEIRHWQELAKRGFIFKLAPRSMSSSVANKSHVHTRIEQSVVLVSGCLLVSGFKSL